MTSNKIQNRALSVRQPFAEQIMLGTKKKEYRSQLTHIRGRIYIYASKTPRIDAYKKINVEPGIFPVGVLVGTVEIVDCIKKSGEYHWILANPKRLKTLVEPETHPQPVWFKPYKE